MIVVACFLQFTHETVGNPSFTVFIKITADARVVTNWFTFQKGWKDGLVRHMREDPSAEPQCEELGTDGSLGLRANLAESMSSVRDPTSKNRLRTATFRVLLTSLSASEAQSSTKQL